MKDYKKLGVLIFSLYFSSALYAQELTLTTQDKFTLKADFFESTITSHNAVLMLHQCNHNKNMYESIGNMLSRQGIHALSLDFRGFGESKNQQYNIEKIRDLPENSRRAAWLNLSKHWPSDVALGYNFLKHKTGKNGQIAVIGASCGGAQAISLAQSAPTSAMVFFSSAQNDDNIRRYQTNLANTPTLIIAAEQDGNTYISAKKLFDSATHSNSKFISYKGAEHGYPLFKKDPNLETLIVSWLTQQL